jgi:hypothetical protein
MRVFDVIKPLNIDVFSPITFYLIEHYRQKNAQLKDVFGDLGTNRQKIEFPGPRPTPG